MAENRELPDFDELVAVADNDWVYVVDRSDTAETVNGTSKKAQAKNARGWPQTTAEAGVTIVNRQYDPGNVPRYGTNTTPSTTDTVLFINNAISAANAGGGGIVKLERGVVHAVDPSVSPIIMKSNVVLDLNGATIQRIGTNTTARMIENDDYQAVSADENIHIISTGAPGKIIGTGTAQGVSDQGHAIGFFGVNTPWSVRNIETDETNGDGLSYRAVGSGLVRDFTVGTYGRNGISPTGVQSGEQVVWDNVDVNGPAIAGANPGTGIDVENSSGETTNHIWWGVRSTPRITFADLHTASAGDFAHEIVMDACEWGPAFNALRMVSTNDTIAAHFVIGPLCRGFGSGAGGPGLAIDNVSGVIDRGSILDCADSTGSPAAISIANTVDGLRLHGTKAINCTRGLLAFAATDLLTNAIIRGCDLGDIYITGNDNKFYDTVIGVLTISRAASIDNLFVNSPPTSITAANSAVLSDNEIQASEVPVTLPSGNATPSVALGNTFLTAGTTAITAFDDGYVGKTIRILATDSITITDGATIILNGSANFDMTDTDTLTLTMFNDQVWQEVARSVN